MRKTISILLISLIFCAMSFCLSPSDEPEYGIFDKVPTIKVIAPVHPDESTNLITINEDPVFKWEKIENKIEIVGDTGNDNVNDDIILFPIEVIIIFSDPIEVDTGSKPKIKNIEDAKYMWDSTLRFGVPGEVSLGNFKVVEYVIEDSYEKLKYTNPMGTTSNDDTPPTFGNLTEPKNFYWVVIAYSPDGEIVRASKEYKFTYDKNYLPPK